MSIFELKELYNSKKSSLDEKLGVKKVLKSELIELEKESININNYIKNLEIVNQIFLDVIGVKRKEIKNKIELWVTKGLQVIFVNENYVFEFDMDVKRDEMYATPKLWSVYKGKKFAMDLSDSNAGAVLDIISFILRMLCLVFYRPALSKIIVADEPFKNTSPYYIPKVAQFLKELSDKLEVQIIMNTHKLEFKEIADKIFEVKQNKEGESVVKST